MLRYLRNIFKIFPRKYTRICTLEPVSRWEFACNADSVSAQVAIPPKYILQHKSIHINIYMCIYMCMCVCVCVYTTSKSQTMSSWYFIKVKSVEFYQIFYYTSNSNPSKTRDRRIFNRELLCLET